MNIQLTVSYYGEIKKGDTLDINLGNKEMSQIECNKDFNYVYCNVPGIFANTQLELKINDNKVTSFDDSTCSSNNDGSSINEGNGGKNTTKSNSINFIMSIYYYLYMFIFMVLFQ